MSNVSTYNLSSIKQLIDLNKDKVNFELEFFVEAEEAKPFEALVVTQEMIDSETPLNYQKADGIISGKIVADKNIYQNYFLLLKSAEPVECKVVINIKDIDPAPIQQAPKPVASPSPQQQQRPVQNRNPTTKKGSSRSMKDVKSWFTGKNLMFFGVVVLAIGFFFWYFVYNKSSSKTPVTTVIEHNKNVYNEDDLSDKISLKISEDISKKIGTKLSEDLSLIGNGISTKISDKVDGLGDRLNDNLNSKVDGLGTKLNDNISNKVDGLGNTLSNKVDGMGSKINDNLSNKVDGLGSRITDNLSNKVEDIVPKLTDNISSKVDNIVPKLNVMKEDYIGEIKTQMEKIKTQSKIDTGTTKKDLLTKRIKDLKIPE